MGPVTVMFIIRGGEEDFFCNLFDRNEKHNSRYESEQSKTILRHQRKFPRSGFVFADAADAFGS